LVYIINYIPQLCFTYIMFGHLGNQNLPSFNDQALIEYIFIPMPENPRNAWKIKTMSSIKISQRSG